MTTCQALRQQLLLGFLLVGAFGVSGLARAQVGEPILVNELLYGALGTAGLGSDSTGNFVVVWSGGSTGTDSDGESIQARRFGVDGVPWGPQFQVNTYTTKGQSEAAVGFDSQGGFVVVWTSRGSSGGDTGGVSIQGQRFNSDGAFLGGQFEVNSYTSGPQVHPKVASNGADGFVVVWSSNGSAGTDTRGESIQGRVFDRDGAALDEQFQVNTLTTRAQSRSTVSPDGAGGFVVSWMSFDVSEAAVGIQAQRYRADGQPVGGQFRVDSSNEVRREPAASPNGAGGFVIVWTSLDPAEDDLFNIHGQRFGGDGSPVGGEFQVNAYTPDRQFSPSVSPDGSGGFVVVWTSNTSSETDHHSQSVHARRFRGDGSAAGPDFQVNQYVTGVQTNPLVSQNGPGGFVVVWSSDKFAGSVEAIDTLQAQRY